jgi:dihydroorotase-like cyclic amidohydrolase
VVDPDKLVTAAGWSPYAGRELRGRVCRVLARGETVFHDGEITAGPGRGAFVRSASTAAAVAHV